MLNSVNTLRDLCGVRLRYSSIRQDRGRSSAFEYVVELCIKGVCLKHHVHVPRQSESSDVRSERWGRLAWPPPTWHTATSL